MAVGNNEYGQLQVQDWNNIAQIAVGVDHIVGLLTDGTVIAVGMNDSGQCDVNNWKDIIQVSGGMYHMPQRKALEALILAMSTSQ